MPGDGAVTLKAWEPIATAFELDGDNIAFTMVMLAPCIFIDINTFNLFTVDQRH